MPILIRSSFLQHFIQCSKIPTLPPISFLLGGVWFNLTAQDYVIQVSDCHGDVRETQRALGLRGRSWERTKAGPAAGTRNGYPVALSWRFADFPRWLPPLLVRLPGLGCASACRTPLDPRRRLLTDLRSGVRPREHKPRCPGGAGTLSRPGRGRGRAGAIL